MSRAERVLVTLVTLHFSFGSPCSREEAIPKPQLTFKTSPRSVPTPTQYRDSGCKEPKRGEGGIYCPSPVCQRKVA